MVWWSWVPHWTLKLETSFSKTETIESLKTKNVIIIMNLLLTDCCSIYYNGNFYKTWLCKDYIDHDCHFHAGCDIYFVRSRPLSADRDTCLQSSKKALHNWLRQSCNVTPLLADIALCNSINVLMTEMAHSWWITQAKIGVQSKPQNGSSMGRKPVTVLWQKARLQREGRRQRRLALLAQGMSS